MLSFLKRSHPAVDYTSLVQKLERGDVAELESILYNSESVHYLPVTFDMLQKMAIHSGQHEGLKLHKKHSKGKFDLLIFELLQDPTDMPFLPLMIDRSCGKIVGIMLPFNELLTILKNKDQKLINALSLFWMSFVMEKRYGIKL